MPSLLASLAAPGLAAYYYAIESDTGVEVSRCKYNNMVDNPKDKNGVCRDGTKGGDCEDCRDISADNGEWIERIEGARAK